MAHTRTLSPLSRPGTVVGLMLLLTAAPWPAARGFPANGRELDSAVDGVQKYLESSGFPKMTRGEVLDFLNDFSRNARVSRSDGGKKDAAAPRDKDVGGPVAQAPAPSSSSEAPRIPAGESPLNYGYPLSAATATATGRPATAARAAAFKSSPADRDRRRDEGAADEGADAATVRAAGARGGPKKTAAGPPVDVNAYAKFKKIPEGRGLKIDDDMRAFLGGFGLLDDDKAEAGPAALRRADADANATETVDATAGAATAAATAEMVTVDAAATETVDAALLRSVLTETGNGANGTGAAADLSHLLLQESASSARGHVFNPSDPDVRTVDVNRIAKIVQNIRLLADDNATVSLSQEAIQRKLENITSAIAAIDRQPASASAAGAGAAGVDKPFDGYDVFFDDDTKEVGAEELPDQPTGFVRGGAADGTEVGDAALPAQRLPLDEAHDPPDPLSTDELQHLLEKNKNDVKRQEPAADAVEAAVSTAPTTTTTTAATGSSTAAAVATSDSSSEAASAVEVTSDPSAAARDSSTAAAADVSPSLSQLAESFGGGETASSSPPQAASPDRPRSGLYFYVDWNSFLTVNEGQKNQVNLRFAPKAGNPAHFIKVNVP